MKIRRTGRADISFTAQLASRFTRQARKVSPPRVGIAWYRKSQWDLLRELDAKPDALEERYEDWLAQAEDTLATLRSRGVMVEKVPIDVEVVARWSAARGLRFNGQARSEYVSELLHKRAARR